MENKIYKIIAIAFIFRLILLIIDQFWFRLPQGGADAIRFDYWAERINLNNPNTSLLEVLSNGARAFASFGATIYSIFGRSPFIWGFTMLLFGVGTVYNVYNATFLITNSYKLALRSAWIACLFPNLAVLSVLILREAPIHFFSSFAIVHLIKYLKFKSNISLLIFFFSTLIAAIFHSAVISIIFGFLLFTVVFNNKSNTYIKIIVVVFSTLGLYYINSSGIGLSKFGGSFEGAIDSLSEARELVDGANSNYPNWLVAKGSISDFLLIPLRMFAFLFAPFIPFFAKNLFQGLGVIDGIFYFVIVWNAFRNRNILMKSVYAKAIVIITLSMVLVFSFGANNFGTNIRHRAKVLPILLILPLITAKENRKYINIANRPKNKSKSTI